MLIKLLVFALFLALVGAIIYFATVLMKRVKKIEVEEQKEDIIDTSKTVSDINRFKEDHSQDVENSKSDTIENFTN